MDEEPPRATGPGVSTAKRAAILAELERDSERSYQEVADVLEVSRPLVSWVAREAGYPLRSGGRWPKYPVHVDTNVSPQTDAELDRRVEATGKPKAAVVRELIEAALR